MFDQERRLGAVARSIDGCIRMALGISCVG